MGVLAGGPVGTPVGTPVDSPVDSPVESPVEYPVDVPATRPVESIPAAPLLPDASSPGAFPPGGVGPSRRLTLNPGGAGVNDPA